MRGSIESSELKDWQAALDVMTEEKGDAYAKRLLGELSQYLMGASQSYWNNITVTFSVDTKLVDACSKLIRWNAAVMVLKAGEYGSEIGGHLSSYASSTHMYEVGLNYFFKGHDNEPGDLILFQGHSSPGIYARSYLMGQLTESQLLHFRREVMGQGLSSYPHPWLMPDYWQFPTVSMGLGPLQGIYHAKLMKYMEARGFLKPSSRKVWVFCGDGEMDEVESIGALGVATRESLDNLIFVINCNLVRLDGPCRGNGQIMQELAGYFQGFGWDVIKVVWSQAWLDLVAKDSSGYLKERLMTLKDGQLQLMFVDKTNMQAWFLGDKNLAPLVEGWAINQFEALLPGGHDIQLVANAFHQATQSKKPCVVCVLTEKGHGLPGVSGKNTSHNQKNLSEDQLAKYAKHLGIKDPALAFQHPGESDHRIHFMKSQRDKLGGLLPRRHIASMSLSCPAIDAFGALLKPEADREFSTTMAFVRVLNILLRESSIAKRIVPILADEGRTLGMEGLFRQIGIYQSGGQQYTPHDRDEVSYYKESFDGQLLQEGLNEAGATSMWLAAATSYSVHQTPLIPIYAYYSMFGFQRVGDIIWAAADSRARGFLIGATAGRTTLGGEGLQHNDATSQLIASTIPNCRSYDPCYAYELAIIMQHGMKEMYEEQKDVFYYITVMNENYQHPEMVDDCYRDVIEGMYCIENASGAVVDLLASGTILRQMQRAAKWIRENTNISIRVWSVTSWSELAKNASIKTSQNKTTFIANKLEGSQLVVAASDYVKALPGLIHEYIACPYYTLGTDGFGMSDTREVLRQYYGVSEKEIAKSVIKAMVDVSLIDVLTANKLIEKSQMINPLADDRRSV